MLDTSEKIFTDMRLKIVEVLTEDLGLPPGVRQTVKTQFAVR